MGSVRPPVECFVIVRVPVASQMLRRYSTRGEPCRFGMHDATTILGDVPWLGTESTEHTDDRFPHDDPAWPKKCRCGYVFKDSDHWEHHLTQKYKRKGTDEPFFTLDNALPGSMWDSFWLPGEWQGGDGWVFTVKLPDMTDFVNDGRWIRTGILPKVTLHPSIQTPKWHGYVRHGYLISIKG